MKNQPQIKVDFVRTDLTILQKFVVETKEGQFTEADLNLKDLQYHETDLLGSDILSSLSEERQQVLLFGLSY